LRIRTQLLILVLFATLVPALGIGVWFIERRDTEIAGTRQELTTAALQLAQNLTNTIRATAQLHYGLSRARDLDTQDQAACSAFLANVLKEYPQYTGILTIKPDGDLLCDSLRTGRTLNLTDRRYFQDALSSKNTIVVEPVFGRLTGIAVLQLAYAARRETGELNFVLLASLNLEKTMQSYLSYLQIVLKQNAIVALVDDEGTVLTWSPAGDNLRGTSIANSSLFHFVQDPQGEEVRENIEFGGVSQIWATSALSGFSGAGLHVLVGMSNQDLFSAVNRNLGQALAILLCGWLVVFVGAWVLARGAMDRELAEGELIRKFNEQLEQKILERTARLESANHALNRVIAEREQADQRFQAEMKQTEALLDATPDPVVIVDREGRITRVNARTEVVFGYPRAEVLGHSVEMLIPELMHATHVAQRAPYHEHPSAPEMGAGRDLFARRRDGSELTVDVSRSPLETAEGTLVIITIRDVTDRRRNEELLHQAQKMETVGNLTGGMAHDFNNLLGVIIGNIDLLRRLKKDDSDVAELTRDALDAALSGADLTRRLLAFARQQPLEPKRVDVNELVSGIARLMRRTLGEDIKISLGVSANLWPVIVDSAQLEASLVNLATNSRDAMPNGGSLGIVTANRHLDADYAAQHTEVISGDYVLIEVSDSGSGMTPELVSRIFEPFFTTKEQGKGTGLGLSMVFGFIKQSGGHISVYSEPGTGTTFRLYLPRLTAGVAVPEESFGPPLVPGGNETILVVEDNASLRRVAVRQLGELGYRALEAENSAIALELMEREYIELLLTDIVMPGGTDGVALAQQARKRWPALKVVFTSGFAEAQARGAQGSLPPDAKLLTQPYRREELAEVIRNALNG